MPGIVSRLASRIQGRASIYMRKGWADPDADSRGTGPGIRSTRSPRYLRRIVRTGTPEGVAVLEASLTRP
jgi:hypothetical protein